MNRVETLGVTDKVSRIRSLDWGTAVAPPDLEDLLASVSSIDLKNLESLSAITLRIERMVEALTREYLLSVGNAYTPNSSKAGLALQLKDLSSSLKEWQAGVVEAGETKV